MSHYHSNIRDMQFVLFELLDSQSRYGQAPFADIDTAAARTVLGEAARYATDRLATTFSDTGREPVTFDPATHSVTLPAAYRDAAADYLDSGWLELDLPYAITGQNVPPSLRWCVTELMLGANPAIPQGLNVIPQVVRLLLHQGTEAQRRLAELILEHRWMVTMVLTEPDAGSDVGAGRTRAIPQSDGSWNIEGVKRFITYGDHDLTDNIIHLVLARPVGVDGAGGPGTRGLSLFVVPKFHFDPDTGDLSDRNGVFVTGLEHKMGLTGSPTCEVTFGADTPAVGWLLGDTHAGLRQMFELIKHLRMLVGVKSTAALSTGYLNAREYATARTQGHRLVGGEGRPVAIIEHPDVRRSLMTQKAYAEGMRALILYTGSQQDRIEMSHAAGDIDREADSCHQLLLPVIKGYCAETSWRVLGQESLQIFGGSGFLTDYPLQQYVRDTKVDSLYEGTTGIQGMDLFSRKILRDGGTTLERLLAEMDKTAADTSDNRLVRERGILSTAVDSVRGMVALLTERWGGDEENPDERVVAAQDTTRLLLRIGDLMCGWLLLRSAQVAYLAVPTTDADRAFYLGKIQAGSWFARQVLTAFPAELESMKNTTVDLCELPIEAF
ncbi:Acyl-CoA dehydrogenase [Rhodococcus wratislaviensis]|uniref:Acyl-CoA dehydrogenase n=2 Tax=Rhodococcus wratislaviensis TaxID=44752 RepID=A0A402C3I3_RHOWR|nr:Acyl-CoA dehydrogenase [Rhodococcus wratislaviensis]